MSGQRSSSDVRQQSSFGAWTAVRVIAGREIAVKLRDKAFLGSTVFMLLLVTAATVIPVLLSQQTPAYRIAVQGEAAQDVLVLATRLGVEAQDPAIEVPPALALTWISYPLAPGTGASTSFTRSFPVAVALWMAAFANGMPPTGALNWPEGTEA